DQPVPAETGELLRLPVHDLHRCAPRVGAAGTASAGAPVSTSQGLPGPTRRGLAVCDRPARGLHVGAHPVHDRLHLRPADVLVPRDPVLRDPVLRDRDDPWWTDVPARPPAGLVLPHLAVPAVLLPDVLPGGHLHRPARPRLDHGRPRHPGLLGRRPPRPRPTPPVPRPPPPHGGGRVTDLP